MDTIDRFNQVEQEAIEFGFAWPDIPMILEQIQSECDEVKSAINLNEGESRVKEEIGDLLHAVFSLCKFLELDGHEVLQEATDKFAKRFYKIKELANADGYKTLQGESVKKLMEYWNQAKNSN